MAHKRKHPEHVNHERWLVSYADFITLLFAFFVVMFASSQVDKKKVQKFSVSVSAAFQDMGVFDSGSRFMSVSASGGGAAGNPLLADARAGGFPDNGKGLAMDGRSQTERTIEAVKLELTQKAAEGKLGDKVSIIATPKGLIIRLGEVGFFGSGSAELQKESVPILDSIAESLSKVTGQIQVEGHTDNVPIQTSKYPSNWELSSSRASSLIAFLLERHAFNPANLSASGYAEFHPLGSNGTAGGRAQNRRVDIVVVNGSPLAESSIAAVP